MSRQRTPHRRLHVEQLEHRCLLAGMPELLKDINLSTNTFDFATGFVEFGSLVYFSANDGTSGRELWKSNGTEAGTVRIMDIQPGILSSNPGTLTNVLGTLYFIADAGIRGFESWILRPEVNSTSLAIAAASATKAEGNTGTTAFTFTVTRSGAVSGATTVNYTVTGNGATPATASDFGGNVFPTGQVAFAVGETSKVITNSVRGDATVESNEGFQVTLANASLGASITTALATGLIGNDETSSHLLDEQQKFND